MKNEYWNTSCRGRVNWSLIKNDGNWLTLNLLHNFMRSASWCILISCSHSTIFHSAAIRCLWKLISQTAGWRKLNSALIDHFKRGVSWYIVNQLLIFVSNFAKDQCSSNHHKNKWFQFSFFNFILKNKKCNLAVLKFRVST